MNIYHRGVSSTLPFPSHLEFEAVHDVLDVGAGQRLSEAQLFGKVDLVVELVQLLQKALLRHGAVQDGAAQTRENVRSTLSSWTR